ncbi:MAG TPA: serine/threonine-protein kinase [Polyangiaceae bacterium]|nr:serine/threonine-protein kinase [Polyangiaceae bacterium]
MRSTGIDAIWAGAVSNAPIRLVYREEPARVAERARPGLVVAQRYELDFPLAASTLCTSSLSTLWHAREIRRGHPVTLQLLEPAIAEDPEILAAFFEEARAAAAIVHPNVAQIVDSGVDSGVPFLALDRLEGESLSRRLHARGRLSPAEVARIFEDVALGLEAIHGWGLVHRRLDPAHLFLASQARTSAARTRDGGEETAKVLFGIDSNLAEGLSLLRQLSNHISQHSVSQRSVSQRSASQRSPSQQPWQDRSWEQELEESLSAPPDTTAYQSPEQLLGHAPVDQRSDLWSLAVIAFEALTGAPAFDGPSHGDRLIQICSGSPSEVPAHVSLPAGFAAWFRKGVCRASSGRFGSVREMAASLSDVLAS